jgi:hypothetical protein
VKPFDLAPDEFQDLVLFWLMDGVSEKGLIDLERQLTLPPPMTKIDKNDPIWSRDAEMAMFKQAPRQR